MKKFLVLVYIEAETFEDAQAARDELGSAWEDARDSGELKPTTTVDVGDVRTVFM